jgi:hypothetical protein
MLVRKRMGLRGGDAIDFVLLQDGTANMRPVKHSVLSLEGRLARAGRRTVSIREIQAAVVKHARRRHRASVSTPASCSVSESRQR